MFAEIGRKMTLLLSFSLEYTLAPLPQTTRGESIKLSGDPKGKTFLYTNGKSVFLRDLKVKKRILRIAISAHPLFSFFSLYCS